MLKRWSSISNQSKVSLPSISMATIRFIAIAKTFHSNYLFHDWFNTHVVTIGFKNQRIASTMAHIWGLETLYYKVKAFYLQ
jgi:hypothetical protein